jgi:hypothetical protein
MTGYGTLRVWAALLTFLGAVAMIAAAAGTIIWAFEVDGFWQVFGVVLFGGAVSVVLALVPFAVAQGLRALANVGETVSAG